MIRLTIAMPMWLWRPALLFRLRIALQVDGDLRAPVDVVGRHGRFTLLYQRPDRGRDHWPTGIASAWAGLSTKRVSVATAPTAAESDSSPALRGP